MSFTPTPTLAPRRSRPLLVGAITLCALGAAGAITGIVVSTGSGHHPASGRPPAAAASTVSMTPSSAVSTLQRELGVLNYYEGPDDGIMNQQTKQAITYLQRQAGLPQTGSLNAATDVALMHELATGDNQMAG
jgi:peptidoglycan hydrolase-like protein with peptidoglycan-binding domain